LKADIQKYFPYVVFVLAVLLYFPTLKHQYAWDDALVIHGNELTKKGFSGLSEIWTSARYIEDRPTYRPIPQTLFAIEWAMAPNNPRLAHFTNIILYGLCCLVLFTLLKRWFSGYSPYLILFISMLFVLHPVHTEVVANIKSRDEILAALFALLAIKFATEISGNKFYIKNSILCFTIFLMAVLSKISAITILPILILIIYSNNKIFADNFLKEFWLWCKSELLPKLQIFVPVAIFALLFRYLYPQNSSFFLLTALLVFLFVKLEGLLSSLIFYSIISFLMLNTGTFVYFHLFNFYFFANLIFRQEKPGNYAILSIPYYLTLAFVYQYLGYGFNIFFLLLIFLPVIFKLVVRLKFLYLISSIVFLLSAFIYTWLRDFQINFFLIAIFNLILAVKYQFNLPKLKAIYIKSIFVAFSLLHFIYSNPHIDVFSSKDTIVISDKMIAELPERLLENQPFYNILVAAENLPEKFATIARVQWLYIQKLFYPHPLVHQYGAWQIELAGFKNWDVWFSIIIHLLLITFVIMRIRKKCPVAMGILFYLVTVSIYTNIIYLMPDTMAERFLFLPSVGFCVALVFGLYQLGDKWLPKNAIAFTGIVLLPVMIFFAQKTWSRSKDWKDNYTLTANTIPFAPNNAVINAQYGAELKKKLYSYPDEFDNHADVLNKIEFHFKRAVELYADFYSANSDLGVFYIEQRRINDAFPYLRKATELNPEKWINHYYLSLIYFEREEYFKAMNGFRAVIDHQDENITEEERTNAYEYLARSYFKLNKPYELKQSLVENYEKHGVKSSMILAGNMLAQKGKIDDALEIFYRLKGDFPGDESINSTIEYLLQFK
jgi:tetratricopeptide (TPR) repeat protein